MRFIISFGAKNVFGFDAKPVTNEEYRDQRLAANEYISDVDRAAAHRNPHGTHRHATYSRVREMEEMEGASIVFADSVAA